MTHMTRFAAPALLALSLALAPLASAASETLTLQEPVAAETLSKSKQTAPGLYITAADAARVLADHPNVALIDVRRLDEYVQAHIKGSKLIPHDAIFGRISWMYI